MKYFFVMMLGITNVVVYAQNRYDVVIDEIMADPTPQLGLPGNEWIELKNTSTTAFNLLNWRIGDATAQSGPLPNFVLMPDSFVIICTSSAVPAMSAFGNVVSVTSFPSLDNDGDQLFLKAANGKIIHAVSYTSGWYRDELKKDGGWTLEMIDPKNPCAGNTNWKASVHATGGTPGKKNSVNGINGDANGPELSRAYSTDSVTIILVYNEPVDSLLGASLNNYSIDGGISLVSASTISPLFNLVQLKTQSPMVRGIIYNISAMNIKDCGGNSIGFANKARVGLPSDPLKGEWIINEILFNPRPDGYDYVEFFNNSNKIFDASRLYIANRNSTGVISSIKALSATPFYIFPGDYIAATEDPANLERQYLVKDSKNILAVVSPPSFPDDEGDVITMNFQGVVVDEVKYKDDWHFKLIDNAEGVALERIDPVGPSQEALNWHSAASTAGYGTPGYRNSQYKRSDAVHSTIAVSPNIFSPDNDGRDDMAMIAYEADAAGWVANISIFDAAGRPVRNLVQNGILGLKGFWNWDGLDDKGHKLPVGTYIIFTEIFNLQGKKNQFKNAVVLAAKLR